MQGNGPCAALMPSIMSSAPIASATATLTPTPAALPLVSVAAKWSSSAPQRSAWSFWSPLTSVETAAGISPGSRSSRAPSLP
jgi:hypothetical protein